ncbi:DUF3173 domain-containing protein [Limosilactobacillus sp. RRLNB_1_1]|uniref:DUF3173 domain-containing protein n=1 Tax=Limosilactobacillus albertensis TaxID=2759752 RepID=A0A7W3TRE9_9LACO|nr:DUF3173 domain-containing protein [Limosilactobacillus albertensis]MBB1069378.1 DUF3173 domain-containing protein [Limosilactobacillus albertensis]MCD7118590.1 DUF3173 domain-containing protein [Limosilactobacillus albertensis]MCD7128365.1 DUF3173 domain-containing protein [Limosilactobacillus albertensis]
MKKAMINYKDLMVLGFKEHQARNIIHQAKINLVNRGLGLYNGKRIGVVPIQAVEDIIGFSLSSSENDNNG